MFLHSRIPQHSPLEKPHPTNKEANYEFEDYPLEIMLQMDAQRDKAAKDFKQQTFTYGDKQDRQRVVIKPQFSDKPSEDSYTIPFAMDSVVAQNIMKHCDIQTLGRMMRLNRKWHALVTSLECVWRKELDNLLEYFRDYTAVDISNETDRQTISHVLSVLRASPASSYHRVACCYRTIRHLDHQTGRGTHYILVEPNGNDVFIDHTVTSDQLDIRHSLPESVTQNFGRATGSNDSSKYVFAPPEPKHFVLNVSQIDNSPRIISFEEMQGWRNNQNDQDDLGAQDLNPDIFIPPGMNFDRDMENPDIFLPAGQQIGENTRFY